MAATNLVPLMTLLFLLDVYELIHRNRSLNFSQDSRSTFARKILTYANGSLSIKPSYGVRGEEIFLFRFHFSPFPQKRLILRLCERIPAKLRESTRSSNLMSASGIRFVGMLGEWIIDLYLELRIVKRRFFSAAVKYTVNRMSTFIIQ